MSRTIAGVLRPALRHRPDAPAIIARSGTLSYAELDQAASAAAGAMWQLGVRPGDRVAACLPNDLDVAVELEFGLRIYTTSSVLGRKEPGHPGRAGPAT